MNNPTQQSEQEELSEDVVFDIMSNRRRRFVLRYLHQNGSPAQLTDIATELAAVESGTSPEQVDKRARKRAYVSLYQTHVPRLAEEGIVRYDEEAGEISLRDPAQKMLRHLGQGQCDDLWPRVYFALAVAGLGIYLPPLAGVASEQLLVTGLFVLLGVLVVSVIQWRYTRARAPENNPAGQRGQ